MDVLRLGGKEFHVVGAATLKPRDPKTERTSGTWSGGGTQRPGRSVELEQGSKIGWFG